MLAGKKLPVPKYMTMLLKTPTLRNIAYTAPYMHNGIYNNLDSVIIFYNRGGGAGNGLKVEKSNTSI